MKDQGDTANALSINGIFPGLCMKAGLGPPRTECGVGAMVGFAERLWVVTYVSSKSRSGVGTGLFEIDERLSMTRRPESYVGTYTNRYVHYPTNQLIIGPHVIDAERNVRTIESLLEIRLCSTMTHLTDPDRKVYMLGMEGELFELDVGTLKTARLAELAEVLQVPGGQVQAHFKAAYSCFGRVVVANNSYDERDFRGEQSSGRLAEWDGGEWRILDRSPYVEVAGRGGFAGTMFATGWDRASALLNVYTEAGDTWTRYRLPKASHTFDHMWQTEWPRIREVDHERFLMDCHGMFYELSPWAYGGRVWGVRPISTHLWVLGDFCNYRGMLVLGSDGVSCLGGDNVLCGEPMSALWFGKTDDLWRFGKPAGWGGPWWNADVKAGAPSDPYLMTGFDKKCLHLCHESAEKVAFTVEVDFLGSGEWKTYETFPVPPGRYVHHEFADGFSAHWVRLTADRDCAATAYLTYT
ncbi:MAG TPA: hypothetical protein VNA25_02755 [Phycisphaerae bacterium]|nr:hypothetical protein [Phycisphaerae bacterium]HUT56777.1 hypothetical protein [Phycisphaerae bacterium]